MIVGDKIIDFLDRVKDKVNCISDIDENETPTEAQIMSRVKEGVKFAHPSLHDLLDLIELDYKTFMSKVEKYTKPNLLVAEKVVAVKVVSMKGRKLFQVQVVYLIIDTRCLIKTEIMRKIVLAVARSDIYCVTILVDKNITTEGEKEKTSTQRRLTRDLWIVQIILTLT